MSPTLFCFFSLDMIVLRKLTRLSWPPWPNELRRRLSKPLMAFVIILPPLLGIYAPLLGMLTPAATSSVRSDLARRTKPPRFSSNRRSRSRCTFSSPSSLRSEVSESFTSLDLYRDATPYETLLRMP